VTLARSPGMSADAPHEPPPDVRAAGGVVIRSGDGELEVLLVHRPRYDDWTFPKGKAERGERDERTALREVEEETGYRCRLVADLGSTRYIDNRGRDKVVRYWAMAVEDGAFAPNHEVDAVVWLTPAAAREQLTYARDRDVLDRAVG
jgi:8-oxo-dGTP pyrophosphatase MutT (NUDIX family)